MKKFVIIMPWLALGGADRCGLDLVRAYRDKGYHTTVIATKHNPRWHSREGDFREFASEVHAKVFEGCDYLEHCKDADIIVVNNSHSAFENIAEIRAVAMESKIICLLHMILPAPWDFEQYLNHSAFDLVWTVSDYLKKQLIEAGIKTPVETLHWFGFRPDVRARLVKRDPEYILCPARLHYQKRPEFIIEIAKKLGEVGYFPKFWLVGEGELLRTMRKLIKEAGLEDQIILKGECAFNSMPGVFSKAIAVLCPSRDEGIPLTYFEAMEAGIPMAVSNVGGVSELVPNEYMVEFECHNEADEYADILAECCVGTALLQKTIHNAYISVMGFSYELWMEKLSTPQQLGLTPISEIRGCLEDKK